MKMPPRFYPETINSLAAFLYMKEFQEFADRLKEVEKQKQQRVKFLQQHNFGEEARWLQKQVEIISEIRMEMEMVANGDRKPSESIFVGL